MKIKLIALTTLNLILLAGCASAPDTTWTAAVLGMSRDNLKSHFGAPLRVEPANSGGENWYYHFVAWKAQPTDAEVSKSDYGDKTTQVSAGLQISRDTEERAIHVSAEGYVIEPLPEGKIVRN